MGATKVRIFDKADAETGRVKCGQCGFNVEKTYVIAASEKEVEVRERGLCNGCIVDTLVDDYAVNRLGGAA
ncbi:hypothetical protein [Natronococcus jeotgali]|uniref:hypothetical protein n=1 Tax=Natronococcus jeotgali TaxID=413812 RepID=UPI001268CF90|nr:hypothetical protein [Natronococcus jeotgali]